MHHSIRAAASPRALLTLAALAVVALTAAASGQSPYGSVEFRWRERAVGITSDLLLIPLGAPPITGAAANTISNPTSGVDARFVLILEARVTRAAGNTDLGGLRGFSFSMVSEQSRSQGTFAGTSVGGSSDLRNAASATAAIATTLQPSGPGLSLPAGATTLPGTDGVDDRGVFGPFRKAADLGGVGGKNQPAIGVQNASTTGTRAGRATLENIVIDADTAPLSTPGGAYQNRNDVYGLDAWAPVFTFVYTVQDVSGLAWVAMQAEIDGFTSITNTGIYGFRGVSNVDAGGADRWLLDSSGIPAFVNFPAPGAAGVLGVAAVFAARRRRA